MLILQNLEKSCKTMLNMKDYSTQRQRCTILGDFCKILQDYRSNLTRDLAYQADHTVNFPTLNPN